MKSVLIITYYWPPSGKASLHWPLKIAKHLPDHDIKPIILTANEDSFSEKDETFLKDVPVNLEVYRAKTFEPFNIYKTITGKKKQETISTSETISRTNKNLAHRLSLWLRMNLFVPDARIGWYFPAVREGSKIISNKKIAAVISIGPPHTTHLAGKKLCLKHKLPHIPVFIDPWTDIAYYKNAKRNLITKKIDKKFEHSVLENAAKVIFVTNTMLNDYCKKYLFLKNKSYLLYWGYSEEEFELIQIKEKQSTEKVIVHAGNLFSYQNPKLFLGQLQKENQKGNKIKLKFIGTVDEEIRKSISFSGLGHNVEYCGFLPYSKMLSEVCNADYLLVCATEPRHVPGKLFEYLRAAKPIIAFGDGNEEVKNILKEANAGMLFRYNESAAEFFTKAYNFKTDRTIVHSFERKQIARKFSEIISAISDD